MENIPSIKFGNLFKRLFATTSKTDTAPVHEWTERHYQLNDPKVSFLESRIAAMEGGVDALAVKSLKSARFKVIRNLVEPGGNVVTLNSWSLKEEDKHLYDRIGVEVRLAEESNLANFRSLFDQNTQLIYLETVSSRFISVPDFIKITSIAQFFKIPVVVDNTASVGGYLFAPLKLNAHLVIESLEEYLPASAKLKAVIIDGGNFNWKALPSLKSSILSGKTNDEAIRSNVLVDLLRQRSSVRFDGYPIPNDPFSLTRRLEDIPAKIQKKSDNAILLARYLKANRYVQEVNYSGLPSGKGYFQALSFFRHGFGHYLTFTLNVKPESAKYFYAELQQHFALGKKISFDARTSKVFVTVPATDFEELKEHFDATFLKLRDFIHVHFSVMADRSLVLW